MNGYRFAFLALCCGIVSAAPGCTQLAGLGGDYRHVTTGGSGAQGGAAGLGANGGSSGTPAGTTGDSGDTGNAGAAASDAGGTGGASAGTGGRAMGNGGASAATGGSSVGTGGDAGGQGGEPNGLGGSGGSGAAAGTSGSAGESGTWAGPVRIGHSVFSDSASHDGNANGHLVNAKFPKPADTQEGDLMLVFFGVDHELTLDNDDLMSRGWTLLVAENGRGMDGQGTYLMYKIADADEPDPIVFEGVNPQLFGLQGLLTVYRGVNQDAPVDSYDVAGVDDQGAEGDSRIETPTPAITTSVSNCLLVAGLSPDTVIDSPVIASWPTGFANELSVKNPKLPYPNGWANIYLAERTWALPATFPESSIAWDIRVGSLYYGAVSFMLALAPAP